MPGLIAPPALHLPQTPVHVPARTRHQRRWGQDRHRQRNPSRLGIAGPARRDPRRFATPFPDPQEAIPGAAPSNLRFFLHSFAATFLFVTIFIG